MRGLVRRTAYPQSDLLPSNPLLARFELSDQRTREASDLQHAFVDPVATLRGLYDLIVVGCGA